MLRSQKRLLKEYLTAKDTKDETRRENKIRLKEALDANRPVPADLGSDIKLRKSLPFENTETLYAERRDDEYRMAGSYEPRILITTSQEATQPCLRFAKELKLLLPGSERINRGGTPEKELVELCRSTEVTDLIEIGGSDGEGRPTMLRVCHFPFGPTAQFTLGDVVLRSDLPEKPPHMSQANPNLIFDNFESKVGKRFEAVLKYLFPVPSKAASRVVTFANINDKIFVRHHTWETSSTLRKFRQNDPALENMTQEEKNKLASRITINEAGPRFTLIPYRITRGTIEMKEAETEWTRATFIRKPKGIL
eukprot:Protomagalhaensia_wolfi_Nauph_80__2182@NODE_2408_length_1100_cov_125_828464_g1884_i0_p1_GENE_NODE_2408_length_1100_cov_125_828464_g1884_i0NODE_2408_length_1100_cov_125_828464_g1884_i0_p1_ORF_typecomplete_len308_score45_52Brix/PF04427_18/5_1e03Brix/PF04427_18/2_1e29_NODE_2408_length_1100_cov_125_828464_g1884_i01151038